MQNWVKWKNSSLNNHIFDTQKKYTDNKFKNVKEDTCHQNSSSTGNYIHLYFAVIVIIANLYPFNDQDTEVLMLVFSDFIFYNFIVLRKRKLKMITVIYKSSEKGSICKKYSVNSMRNRAPV